MKDEFLSREGVDVYLTKNHVLVEHEIASKKCRVDATGTNSVDIIPVFDPDSLQMTLVFGNGFSLRLTQDQIKRIKSCL